MKLEQTAAIMSYDSDPWKSLKKDARNEGKLSTAHPQPEVTIPFP